MSNVPALTGGVDPDTYQPAKLKPITDPLELRDATVRDYMAAARAVGVDVNAEDVRKTATEHLVLVDHLQRGYDPTARPPVRKEKPARAEAAAELSQLEQPQDGVRLKQPGEQRGKVLRPDALYKKQKPGSRAALRAGRVRRITAGMVPVFTAAGTLDFEASCKTAEHPRCAAAYYRLWGNYMQRHRRSRHNPFKGLSELDAMRMFIRGVEDICDSSADKFGPWWTPK